MTIPLPIGVERILTAGALAQGVSLDEFKAHALTEYACNLADADMAAELVSMGLEEESDRIVKRRRRRTYINARRNRHE